MRYIDFKILLNIPLFEESVFNHYLKINISYLPIKLQSPFYEDNNPSFSLFYHDDGKLLFKDFKHDWTGDCFNLVQRLYGISFKESIYKIAKDLHLLHLYDAGVLQDIGEHTAQRVVVNHTNVKPIYTYKIKQYTKYEINFWQNFGLITKELLEDNDVFSASKIYLIKEGNVSINIYNYNYLLDVRNQNKCCLSKEFIEDMKKSNLCFIYNFNEHYNFYNENKIKIYRPYCNKDKWRGNCNIKTISGLKQLTYDRNKILIVAKAKKEELALKSLQPFIDTKYDVISTISEGAWFNKEDWYFLKQYYDKIILWFDNDVTGINNSSKYSQIYGTDNIIFDNPYKNITDLYQGELINNNRYIATNEAINLIKYYLNGN